MEARRRNPYDDDANPMCLPDGVAPPCSSVPLLRKDLPFLRRYVMSDGPDSCETLSGREKMKVVTNSHRIDLDLKTQLYYEHVVSIWRECSGHRRYLINPVNMRQQMEKHCFTLIRLFLRMEHSESVRFAYDGKDRIYMDSMLTHSIQREFAFRNQMLPLETRAALFDQFKIGSIYVRIVSTTRAVNLHGVVLPIPYDFDPTKMVRAAIFQKARENGALVLDDIDEIYDRQEMNTPHSTVAGGIELKDGLQTSLRVAEGPPTLPQIVLDFKQRLFFANGRTTLLSFFDNYTPADYSQLVALLTGLRVYVDYYVHNRFTIAHFTEEAIGKIQAVDGTPLHVVAESVLPGVPINENLPAVIGPTISRDRHAYFPLEHLIVAPGQRLLPIHKRILRPPGVARDTHDPPPSERHRETIRLAELFHILGPNEEREAFGIQIHPECIEVKSVRLPAPKIVYGGGVEKEMFIDKKTGKYGWEVKGDKKSRGAVLNAPENRKVLLIHNFLSDENGASTQSLGQLCKMLETRIASVGMSVGEIETVDFNHLTGVLGTPQEQARKAVKEKLKEIRLRPDKPYVLYVDETAMETSEAVALYERLFKVLVQQYCIDSAIADENVVLNMILKMNEKMGGLNHGVKCPSISHLWGDSANTLVISYHDLEPTDTVGTSSIGFGHNGGRNKQLIIGDFVLHKPTQEEKTRVFQEMMGEILGKYMKNNDGKLPERVVVLRESHSNDQNMIERKQMFSIISAMATFLTNKKMFEPLKFALITVNDKSGHRLYTSNGSPPEYDNVPVLTAVDTDIVCSSTRRTPELILVHRACGKKKNGCTANPLLLTLVVNLGGFATNNEIGSFVAAQCCIKQQAATVTLLPESIFRAKKEAERALHLHNSMSLDDVTSSLSRLP